MVTQTRPNPTESQTPVRELDSRPIAPARTAVHLADRPAPHSEAAQQPAAAAPAKESSFAAQLVHRLAAAYDWLSGPPTTASEPNRATMADAENILRGGRFG